MFRSGFHFSKWYNFIEKWAQQHCSNSPSLTFLESITSIGIVICLNFISSYYCRSSSLQFGSNVWCRQKKPRRNIRWQRRSAKKVFGWWKSWPWLLLFLMIPRLVKSVALANTTTLIRCWEPITNLRIRSLLCKLFNCSCFSTISIASDCCWRKFFSWRKFFCALC